MVPHKLFAPRRIGVCGSSRDLSQTAVAFCRAVGTELAATDYVIIVSGGTHQREGATPDNLATDWHIVNAAAGEVRRRKGAEAVDQQIETVRSHDVATTEFFSIGTS